jgi:alanyl-tRNA synthetase
MTSSQIRQAFLDFFKEKEHKIVSSAPMVIKNDPTLMFTNAGMNQFKDFFLGNEEADVKRVSNSQKCLRVSGKHNDLEEVGHDTYHHTMFEMLGNWSFGDYFKKEAIDWAWEFLTEKLGINKDLLYVTVFEGDAKDKTGLDQEAAEYWKKHIPEDRVLKGSKKDNFWEMGETGPCGPCSEIHVDLRPEDERRKVEGAHLVNKDNPLVIEIWNLVFIQYNRKSDGRLEILPNKHVDTGMGFERLCMVVQGKKSNYDTDIFQGLITRISEFSELNYGEDKDKDVAMRVVSDHLRAIAFSIADGQLPSNNKAGYVIRRILRRAVRYAYTFLNQDKAFMYKLVPELIDLMGDHFPELKSQQALIEKVIKEEEFSFLKTLEKGIGLLEQITAENSEKSKSISGKTAFELYDTYGFPLDLTQLILREKGMEIRLEEFEKEMELQKNRSKQDAQKETSDWIILNEAPEVKFVGYDQLTAEVRILRYRKINQRGKELYQLVFNQTPFYAESGGQVGDSGYIDDGIEKISVIDTIKENNLIIHLCKQLPKQTNVLFKAVVSRGRRINIANNHTSTHLLHFALKEVLGKHVEQKGSLVNSDYLRFDFSHFQKLSDEEILKIETIVNEKIRDNISLDEKRNTPIAEAKKMGAVALFGEKYGDKVRVVSFGDSVELCGGTHAQATGQIGFFKIIKESAIAAGIRRIEAVSGEKCQELIFQQNRTLNKLQELFPASKDILVSVSKALEDNINLTRKIDGYEKEKLGSANKDLKSKISAIGEVSFIGEVVEVQKANDLRDLSFQLKAEIDDLFMILAAEIDGKANISIAISDKIINEKNLNAADLIKIFAKEIQGGGGGQAFFATAGGKNPDGLQKAIVKAREFIEKLK